MSKSSRCDVADIKKMQADEVQQPLRILELYSGIGGMHVAAKESGLLFDIVGSYEINTTALEVYRHNFPKTPKAYNIMGLTLDNLESLSPDIIMMSPPCQPFTRQGLKRDVEDTRTSSLLHLIGLLEKLSHPPTMILLENVAGFEKSLAREQLMEMLRSKNYVWQEFLLSPTEFGIPNSRLRYYLLAKQQLYPFCLDVSDEIKEELTACLCIRRDIQAPVLSDAREICANCGKPVIDSLQNLLRNFHGNIHNELHQPGKSYSDLSLSLSSFMESDINLEPYLLKDKVLSKYCMILDIVDKESKRSCCFTKGYGHYVEGTGSVIKGNSDLDVDAVYNRLSRLELGDPERLDLLKQLKFRYFTANEILRLMCFPKWFSFPPSLTVKQKYRVLGNSINILVVTSLLLILCER
ncbi:tRNA (cytosine(38)-C(5))-methyltransferase-like isoform X2 [Macrobrachium nipponense]